jgi:hypothetical protein
MPKKPSDYSKCVIYKLVSYDTTLIDCYVGHTTNFTERKRHHKNAYFNENHTNHSYPVYVFMREHGGWENFIMLQMEEFPCETKREAEAREEHWRKELHATLNGCRAFTTDDEKRIQRGEINREWQKNKGHEKHLLSVKKYANANKEKILQKKKTYREKNKEKINLYMKDYRQRKKLEKLNNEIPETNIIEN